jgi:hypothetical protein
VQIIRLLGGMELDEFWQSTVGEMRDLLPRWNLGDFEVDIRPLTSSDVEGLHDDVVADLKTVETRGLGENQRRRDCPIIVMVNAHQRKARILVRTGVDFASLSDWAGMLSAECVIAFEMVKQIDRILAKKSEG